MNAKEFRKKFPFLSKLDQFVEDVGYSIANIFGLGEEANKLINGLKSLLTGKKFQTVTSNDLINVLRRTLGDDIQSLTKAINVIDSKLGNLPIAYSGNIRKVTREARSRYLKERQDYASQLQKAETTMNLGVQTASMQDMSTPSVKHSNQQLVDEMVTEYNKGKSEQPNNNGLNAVERTINNG